MPKPKAMVLWLAIAVTVIVLDQLTKMLVEQHLPAGASVVIAAILDLVHVRNSGAAFSFLADASGWQRELFIGIGVIASLWMVWMLARARRGQWLFCLALSLILGGALGNVIDRFRHGAVVDFLHFHGGAHYWPAFNVADSAITCGAILLIADAIIQGRRERASSSPAQSRGG
jgi:signal peptidase II